MSTASSALPTNSVVANPESAAVAPPMKTHSIRRWSTLLTASTLFAFGAVAGAIGYRQFIPPSAVGEKSSADQAKAVGPENDIVSMEADKQAAAGVEIIPIKSEPLVSRVWRTGRIAFHEERLAHICPPAEGVVREVPVRLGQIVASDDVLAVLDSRELGQAKLEAYKARVALAAERELAMRTKTTMSNAEELLKLLAADIPLAEVEKRLADKPIGDWRQQLLVAYTRRTQLRTQLASQQASGGAVAEATVRKTEAEMEAAAAAYTALYEELRFQVKNQVRQANLKLKDAETTHEIANAKLLLFGLTPAAVERLDPIMEGATASHLTVRAPFAGTVVEKHAVRSERVNPQSQMFMLADLSRVWVQADVFESDLPLIRGQKERAIVFRSAVAGVPERTATVVYNGDLFDKSSRSLTLTAEADNGDRVLKPGMFVEVGFDTGDRTPVLQIPITAVLRHENQPFVFVQTDGALFRRVNVTLGRTAGEKTEVTAGLQLGDKVVVRGGFVLKSELLKDQMIGE